MIRCDIAISIVLMAICENIFHCEQHLSSVVADERLDEQWKGFVRVKSAMTNDFHFPIFVRSQKSTLGPPISLSLHSHNLVLSNRWIWVKNWHRIVSL